MAKERVKYEEVHVIPVLDIIKHQESIECDCQPYWDPENKKDFEEGKANKMVWVHNLIKDKLH